MTPEEIKARREARGADDPLNRLTAHINKAIAEGVEPITERPALDDQDTRVQVVRDHVLKALDQAAERLYGLDNFGWKDPELPALFAAVDRQAELILARAGPRQAELAAELAKRPESRFLSVFRHNPRKVNVSKEGVAAFNATWPCSELRPSRSYWFEFDADGDLVDMDVPQSDDGQAATALYLDCKAWLFEDTLPEWESKA